MSEWFNRIQKFAGKYEFCLIVALSYFLSLLIFRFDGLMNFYDLITVPFVYNYTDESIVWPYNFLRLLGLPAGLITSLIFQLIFTTALALTYFSLKGFLTKIWSVEKVPGLTLFGLSFLYAYNPWTFERFLMGQYEVLAGYALLIWAIYCLFRFLKKTEFQTSKTELRDYLKMGLVVGTVAYVGSVHFGGFVIGVLGVLILIKIIGLLRKKNFQLKKLTGLLSMVVLVTLPTIILLGSKYYDAAQLDFYQESVSINQETRQEIIRGFQIRTHSEDQNLYVRALTGSGIWASSLEKFYLNPIEEQLGFLPSGLYYFNNWLSLVFAVLLITWIVWLTYSLWKRKIEHKSELIALLLIGLTALVLNFGYAGGFEPINQWFYKLPLISYTYREAGKFYSLFWACLIIISALIFALIQDSKQNQPKKQLFKQGLVEIILCMVAFSNYMLFLPIPNTLKPTVFPEVLTKTEERCRADYKVLYLPIATHATADYNPIPHLTPTKFLLNCPVVEVEFASLRKFDSEESVIFSQNRQAQRILEVIDYTIVEKKVDQFLELARENDVGIVILNTYNTEEVRKLNGIFIQQDWKYEREGTNYVYYLPDFE